MPRKKNDSSLIPGSRLKEAMKNGLAIVGPAGLQSIFEDLERRGVGIETDVSCPVDQLDNILREMFGEDASKLMMTRIYQALGTDESNSM